MKNERQRKRRVAWKPLLILACVVGVCAINEYRQLTVKEFDWKTNRYLSELIAFTKDPTASKGCLLKSLYGDGSIEKDLAYAAAWYRQAADRGDAEVQFILGVLYRRGEGVPQDYLEATMWFEKAGEQGHVDAQFLAARMYCGLYFPEDLTKAARWYEMAARQGHVESQYRLGSMYGEGLGVEKNIALAYEWLIKAAKNGSTSARETLDEAAVHGML